ncbi:D-alanine--D-alanine ligase family protein [Dactylosporangium sp. AC04546]|uniref:D-alanine--D-alanine ligase family protein n=1 Tax=Dactylosporangium sp. AC04546 TaxID=2862460 RepID=UPI001EDF04A7|nr:D-alanine--D-alanine ligase family protein [Dactylosporangium sp. AC04546]WVK81934.1 D-alanine--D-alanine ligase family protein [Dactylosporangium sp. AC04546]
MTEERKRVAVVFGGRSGEHEVSCKSALSIVRYLDRSRYDVVPVRITPNGTWVFGADAASPEELDLEGLLALTKETGEAALASLAEAIGALREADVVFPAIHGPYGEDGTIQSVLEMVRLPYVGSGVFASAAGMDKEFTKKLLVAEGLPVADGVVLRGGTGTLSAAEKERLGLPVFVKPSRAGSSLGVSKVEDWSELEGALSEARDSDAKVLVEEMVHGREVDLGVLEHPDGSLQVGPPLEIRFPDEHEFFDYEAKYLDPSTIFDIPARLDPEIIEQLQDLSVRTFRALECRGLLRVDFFLRYGTEPVINEVNTFPGFTAVSQYPQMFRVAGLDYPALCDVLLRTALARQERPALPR